MPIRRLFQASLTNGVFSTHKNGKFLSYPFFLAEINRYSRASILSINDSILLKTGA